MIKAHAKMDSQALRAARELASSNLSSFDELLRSASGAYVTITIDKTGKIIAKRPRGHDQETSKRALRNK